MRRYAVASLVLVVALAGAAAALSAPAGPPGVWTKVTSGDRRNIDDVGLARTSNGVLHVLWQRRTGPIETSIVHTVVSKAGKVGGTNPVVTGLRTVDDPAVLVLPDGRLQAFFAALGDSVDESGVAGAVAPASGHRLVEAGRARIVDDDVGRTRRRSVDCDGTPAFAYSATSTLGVHIGTDAVDADLVRAAGQAVLRLRARARDRRQDGPDDPRRTTRTPKGRSGTWVRPVAPKVGKPTRAPGSVTGGKSLGVDQHVALSSRLGEQAGVYVGYCSGYPVCKSTLLWRVGGGKPLKVGGSDDVEDVDVAPGPDGRLWVMWHDGRTKQLHATRTNKAATRVGPLVTLAPPKGTSNMWKLAGEGSLGPLDVLVSATVGGALQTWHTQVLPRLQLTVKKSGKVVKLTVTDAGDPVAGADGEARRQVAEDERRRSGDCAGADGQDERNRGEGRVPAGQGNGG